MAVLAVTAVGAAGATGGSAEESRQAHPYRPGELVEATIPDLQRALARGTVTSRQLVERSLARIAAYDDQGPSLHAVITVNPRALEEAAALDAERAATGPRGPLHGIPVVVKDNYDTADMATTAGSAALAGVVPPDDAFQVRRLREAGAIILAKTNLHEFAFGWDTYSSLGGQTLNPYDLTRKPGGSSGGTGAAVAASFAVVGLGTDTCGSIRVPAALNNLVGVRPTKGLSSIDGIVPLSMTQDVGGPLARSVVDAAIVLDATVGFDPADPITALGVGRVPASYTDHLDPEALRGARIGVLEEFFGTGEEAAAVNAIVRRAAADMAARGAELVPVAIPGLVDLLAASNVLVDEFMAHIEQYLAATPGAPQRLQEIIDSGLVHPQVLPLLELSRDAGTYGTEVYKDKLLARDALRIATLAAMAAEGVDVLLYPTLTRPAAPVGVPQPGTTPNCRLSPHTGMPAITLPAGFTPDGLPVGVELLGRPFEEGRLLGLGYAYEQATHHRRPPVATPPLDPQPRS